MLANYPSSLNLPSSTGQLSVHVRPSKPIVFTSELNITAMLEALKITDQTIRLIVSGISGIEVTSWPLVPEEDYLAVEIEFEKSKIEFYINGTRLKNLKCSKDVTTNKDPHWQTFFSIFSTIKFLNGNNYTSDTNLMCPFIFRNSQIGTLDLFGQTRILLFLKDESQNRQTKKKKKENGSYQKLVDVSGIYNKRIDN
jgi:hypothetical protein